MLRSDDSIDAEGAGDADATDGGNSRSSGELRRRVTFADRLKRVSSRVDRPEARRSLSAALTPRRHTSLIRRRSGAYLCQQLGDESRKVSVFGLVVLGFFWISGGIYGNEELVQAAPIPYIFALCVVAPLVYSLPLAFMCTEMASAMPVDGASVVFVQEAFGDEWGAHNALWCWLISVVDAAVYPSMAASYIDKGAYGGTLDDGAKQAIAIMIVLLMTVVNLGGMEWIMQAETAMAVITIVPCLVFIVAGLGSFDAAAVTATTGVVDWTKLLSWVMWLYSGFNSFGTLAGEIEDPGESIPLAVWILVPIVTFFNSVPYAIAVSVHPQRADFEVGYFTNNAVQVAGPWLGTLFTVSSVVMLVGTYDAQIIGAERTMFCFLEEARGSGSTVATNLRRSRAMRMLVSCFPRASDWLLSRTGEGVRRIYVVINSLIVCFLTSVNYNDLVEFEMFLGGACTVLFAAAFVQLRRTRPTMPRPYKIGGGFGRAVFIAALPITAVVSYWGVGFWQVAQGKRDALVGIAGLLGAVFIGLVLQTLWRCCCAGAGAAAQNDEGEKSGIEDDEHEDAKHLYAGEGSTEERQVLVVNH